MPLLSREQILAAADRAERRTVAVPEWGGDVLVQLLSGTDRDEWEQANSDASSGEGKARRVPDFRARFVAFVVVDDTGKRLFTAADVTALGQKSAAALDRVFNAAWTFNGMGKEGVEQAEKNSAAGPAGASSSNSPASTDSSPVSSLPASPAAS